MGVMVAKQDATLFIMGTSGFLCARHWTPKHLSKTNPGFMTMAMYSLFT